MEGPTLLIAYKHAVAQWKLTLGADKALWMMLLTAIERDERSSQGVDRPLTSIAQHGAGIVVVDLASLWVTSAFQ